MPDLVPMTGVCYNSFSECHFNSTHLFALNVNNGHKHGMNYYERYWQLLYNC